jgi:hypothetical protein
MTVPFRTFALFGAALGVLAAGYLFAPEPGDSLAAPTAKVVPPAPPKPETTLVANRPPVPLVTAPRATHNAPGERTAGSPASGDNPTADMGTFDSNPADPNDTTQALVIPASGDDGQARRAIEFDGYKNVRGLVKSPDGSWRGRALRGRTEIAVRVDASGNVSAE